MVKLILPNSAPPGQESQKCPKNSATDLVTPRKTRAFVTSRSDFVTSRQSKNLGVGHLAQGEKTFLPARGDQSRSFSVHLFSRHFWLSWAGGAELGKKSFAIEFVYENYKF